MFTCHPDYERLEELLIPSEQFHPLPKIGEREAWEAVPLVVRDELVRAGEQRLYYDWPSLPASGYMEFFRNGNRNRYEQVYFERRQAVAQLVMAECVEDLGRFLDQIINGLWLICEESSWVIPAHNYLSVEDSLPDITEPAIDLFAGETAGLLTWTYYLLGARLDTVSPMVGKRVELEMKERILDPYLKRNDFWWLGFTPRAVNNWNPWINSHCLAAFLIFEKDESRRVTALRKVLRSLDAFIRDYPGDGGCDEGPGYWSRSGGSLFECLEILYSATNGKMNFYDHPLIRDLGRYVYRVHIDGAYFVNFADGDAVLNMPAELIARYGERIGDAKLAALGKSAMSIDAILSDSILSLSRAVPYVLAYGDMSGEWPSAPFVRDSWFESIQTMTAREQEGSGNGLYLAVKGGHNGENHNHNDVGQFIVYADGKPFLVDVGVETYSAQTFSSQRYEIWTMRSAYHNVPVIDGIEQLAGLQYRAVDVCYFADDSKAELSLNIAGAYPEEAGISAWIRTCRLQRLETSHIEILDNFQLKHLSKAVTLNLMTPYKPQHEPGAIVLVYDSSLRLQIQYSGEDLAVTEEEIAITDNRLRRVWGESLYRIALATRQPVSQGNWSLVIKRL